jgi:hypothetical protein
MPTSARSRVTNCLKKTSAVQENCIFLIFQTQNNVYEILSDVSTRQDIMDERIASLEEKLHAIQVSMDVLPDLLSR